MNQAHETEHLIRLEELYPSGAEEWICIYCERRVMKQREPVDPRNCIECWPHPGSRRAKIIDTEISEELWLALEEVFDRR